MNNQLEVLDLLPLEVGILNEEGLLTYTNEAWQKRSHSGVLQLVSQNTKENSPFLKALENLVHGGYDFALQALMGIQRVKKRELEEFVFEYHGVYPAHKERFLFKARSLNHGSNDILLMQESVTDKQQTIMREKEALVHEMHHRVKNNLALVIGMLQLQQMNMDNHDGIQALENTRSRIYSIAAIHELLYQSDTFSSLDVGIYLESIAKMTLSVHRADTPDLPLRLRSDVTRMPISKAVPFGILFNEIFGSMLHEHKNVQHPQEVQVFLKNGSSKYSLMVRYGRNELNPIENNSFGYDSMSQTLIELLQKQLKADMRLQKGRDSLEILVEFSV